MKRVLWFAFFLIMAVSCLDEPDCYRQNLNLMGISFKKMYDGKADTVVIFKAYSGDAVMNTLFYDSTKGATTALSLPLDYLKNNTSFTIEGDKVYTLQVSHKSKTQFVSEDCGSRFILSDLGLISNNFDSIRIVSTSLANPAHINIEVYRCPRTNIMRFSFRQLYMDIKDTLSLGKADVRTVDTVTVDGSILWKDVSLSTLLLPVNPNASSTAFSFKLGDDDVERHFTVDYTAKPLELLSKCGTQNFFTNIKTTDNNFPLLKVAVDSIYDPPHTNLISYRCPITDNIKVLFKKSNGSSKVSDSLHIETLTDDFSGTPLYSDDTLASFTLRLNPNATSTTYTFSQKEGTVNTLTAKYVVTPTTFHDMCGSQPVFTELEIVNSDFVALDQISILDPKVKFPAVNNIEILR
jgi:hypothetical protein